jgi:hypothetical protein
LITAFINSKYGDKKGPHADRGESCRIRISQGIKDCENISQSIFFSGKENCGLVEKGERGDFVDPHGKRHATRSG